MALVFHTNPMSRGRMIRWLLEELGVAYETRIWAYGPDGLAGAEYRAINPMMKVPAIQHDGRLVTEVAAICLYLADAFPQAGLAPPPADRADYYRWLLFAAGPIEQAVGATAMGWTVPDDPQKQGTLGFGSVERVTDALESFLAGRAFVQGDRFSAADLYLSSMLGWPMQFGLLPKRPAFLAYVARHQARPAYARAAAIDDALLPPRS